QHAQIEVAVAVDRQAGDTRLEAGVGGDAGADLQAAAEILERRVTAATFAGQAPAIEGGDGAAQLLLEIGVDQHSVADQEAGVAVEVLGPGLLAVAAGGEARIQIQSALHRRRLTVAGEERLDLQAADLLLQVQLGNVGAQVDLR